jgi:uridine kinase
VAAPAGDVAAATERPPKPPKSAAGVPSGAMGPEAKLVEAIVDRLGELASCRPSHPVRVGVDGRSAAGKTTFADRLAAVADASGRNVVRASIDDFHPPGHKRRHYTVETYYDFAFDYGRFRSWVLDPLGPGGDRRCRLAYRDSFNDVPASSRVVTVPDDGILIVDGAFLLRPELSPGLDLVIWLHVPFEVMVNRAVVRDTAWVGDADQVWRRYTQHWIPLHELYERLSKGPEHADLVIDNSHPEHPKVLRASWPICGCGSSGETKEVARPGLDNLCPPGRPERPI